MQVFLKKDSNQKTQNQIQMFSFVFFSNWPDRQPSRIALPYMNDTLSFHMGQYANAQGKVIIESRHDLERVN